MKGTRLLETCRELKQTYTKKELCVKLIIYQNYTELHGQQNVKYFVYGLFKMKQILYLPTRTSPLITYSKQFIDFKECLQVRIKYFDFFQFLLALVVLFMDSWEFSLKAAV
jgi:hypothetical protein